ncbi:Histidine kinase [Burkholderiales bacterium 8X]|nr:Histidine kinase [Burkholderiales bacterium 8X]
MNESQAAIDRDVAAVGALSAVPVLLRIICESTGMGFAAVARVTDTSWTACAVHDQIAFGLRSGGQLDVSTTLCTEAREARRPIVIDDAGCDPIYRDHHTPRIYGIKSYVSVPIVFSNGDYFGNLCAIDPNPAAVSNERTLGMFNSFAELIARQLEDEEQVRSREQLHRATETALLDERATAELREQFIAVLGHDLRNPLAAVEATADLLTRRQEEDIVRIARRLKTSSRRMSRLIDDVLDFARGRLGSGMGVNLVETDSLGAALRDVVAESREAHVERAVIADIDIPRPVRCDEARVQQLLSNLIGNALTHGSADVPIEVESKIAGPWLVLSVRNGGQPIPEENLARVFEPFWRPLNSHRGGGLGLGLHICSQIVAAHGGRLEVRSTVDDGTTFTVWLPLDGGANPAAAVR